MRNDGGGRGNVSRTYTHVAFGPLEGADDALDHLVDIPHALELAAEGSLADILGIKGLLFSAGLIRIGDGGGRLGRPGRLWPGRQV